MLTPKVCRCWPMAARARCNETVDVRDLDIDFYAVTGHKLWYGPTGIGALAMASARHLKDHASLQRRRRDDPRGHARHGHLCRSAGALRGGHAAPIIEKSVGLAAALDYLGIPSTCRRRVRMSTIFSPMPAKGCASSTGCVSSAMRRARARSCLSRPTACMRTTSRQSSTGKVWRCAPAITAPMTADGALRRRPRPRARHSRSTQHARRCRRAGRRAGARRRKILG